MRQPDCPNFPPQTPRRGFTIIEILVVVVIIIGLVAFLIPHLGSVKRSAQRTAAIAHLGAVQAGIQAYYAEMSNTYPSSTTPAYSPTNPIIAGRGSAALAQALMGYLPIALDGAGPPSDPVFGFRLRQSSMGGRVYGPYMSTDPKGYRRNNIEVDESFIDPWGNEILYYRAARPTPDPSLPTIKFIFDVGVNNDSYFNSNDCATVFDPSTQTFVPQANPMAAPAAFFKLICARVPDPNPNKYVTGNNGSGQVMGTDSYLLISAGPDAQYFTGDDIVYSKP